MLIVSGDDRYKQLPAESNMKKEDGTRIVCPPKDAQIDTSTLISFSSYCWHSVWVDKSGTAHAIGNNDGQIWPNLPKGVLRQPTEFTVQNRNGEPCILLSAVCGLNYTLYLISPRATNQFPTLAFVCKLENEGQPIFLETETHHPKALFGGSDIAAAVCDDGAVLIISRDIIKKGRELPLIGVFPGFQIIEQVACCKSNLIALSTRGKVFISDAKSKEGISAFSEVPELSRKICTQVSGTHEHFFVVIANGSVYARGQNDFGKLGFDSSVTKLDEFKLIKSLKPYPLLAAYAGASHSLFQTKDGKIFACGTNSFGQLLLDEPSKEVYLPTLTTVTRGVAFCIAGSCRSAVFVGREVPPNSPNLCIHEGNVLTTQEQYFRSELARLQGLLNQALAERENYSTKAEILQKQLRTEIEKNDTLKDENVALKREIAELQKQVVKSAKIDQRLKDNNYVAKFELETPD